jgi:hypothetical protein
MPTSTPPPSPGETVNRAAFALVALVMLTGVLSGVVYALSLWLGLRLPPAAIVGAVALLMVWLMAEQHPSKAATPPTPPRRASWEQVRAAAALKERGHLTEEQFSDLLDSALSDPLPPRQRRR